MKVVILCGGQGTRIREVSENVPKPMIELGGRPILWHVMKTYAHFGHEDFVLCLGYKGHVVRNYFLNYRANTAGCTVNLGSGQAQFHSGNAEANWNVTLADTGLSSMTGARIANIKHFVEGEDTFMLTYGDGVGNVDIDALLAFHKSHGKIATVSGMRPPARFGELKVGEDNAALEFNEKPQATAGRISGGYFVLNKEIFNYLPAGETGLVFEKEPINRLVEDKQLMVYKHDGFWHPMDTARDHNLLTGMLASGAAPWKLWK